MEIGSQRVARDPRAVHSEVLDELVVFVPHTSCAVALNVTARAIWQLCDGRTMDQICAELASAAAVSPSAIRADVTAAIGRLQDLGLVCRVPG